MIGIWDECVINSAVPAGQKVYCRILRHCEGLDKLYPNYEVYLEAKDGRKVFLMSARKRKKSKNTNYMISMEPICSPGVKTGILGKVRYVYHGKFQTEGCLVPIFLDRSLRLTTMGIIHSRANKNMDSIILKYERSCVL